MPHYRIVVKGTFSTEIYADDEDDAWAAADEIDLEDMRCHGFETMHVEEIQ